MDAATQGIIISDVQLTKPSWKFSSKIQIVIKCGSQEKKSQKTAFREREDRIAWNESFFFGCESTDDIPITFTIVRINSRIILNTTTTTIDSCEHRVIDLLKMQNGSESCKLDIAGNCQLTFKIEKSSDVVLGAIQQTPAVLGSQRNMEVPVKAKNSTTSAVKASSNNEDTWSPFLENFEVFMDLIDHISNISPYAKMAWGVLSVIPKTIIAKKKRDDKIKQLCDKLEDVYNYIKDADRLHELTKAHSETLSKVVRQTLECAYFIRAYCTEDTVHNILKGITGSADSKIQDFNNTFDRLMETLKNSVNLETSIVTLRVKEGVDNLVLNGMRYSGSYPEPGKQCLPGTRKTLIKDILKQLNDDASPQILVVSGQAGVGKSTMAHTIAGMFKAINRLGSIFCFDKGSPNKRNCLFSTISLDLAYSDASWREELIKIINSSAAIQETEDPETQFNEFIIKPSKSVATIGPVIIVVDESGDREKMLEILFRRWTELPKNYRIIVTTRPEQDIEAQLERQKLSITCIRMGDIDSNETYHDIKAYVSNRLYSISSTLDSIDEDWRGILAERAQNLFQWAETACRFIDKKVTHPELIRQNWDTCVSNSSSSLYKLYHQIILSQPESRYPWFKEQFKVIVGAIVTAQEPLSIHMLQNILEDDIKDIRSILSPFGSFFSGIYDSSALLQPLHTSLFDFFMTETFFEKDQQDGEKNQKINEYYINMSDQTQMTLSCLKVMNRMLCFNICHLETSHLRNLVVPNLKSRIKEAIPVHLSYSCRFWSFHLQSSPVSGELIRAVRTLLDDKLIYYFEALTLLNAFEINHRQCCVTMQAIVNWCKDADTGLAEDAMDAWEFAFDFGDMMNESTPHIYLSALPFTPRSSFVSRKYLERFPGLFTFDVGQPMGSSRRIGFMQRSDVGRFAFSPKGEYIASATRSDFCVWNYVTGEEYCRAAYREHFDLYRVCDIVFSHDGELVYCCFDYGGILIFNMGTKVADIERCEEIVGVICRSCTISSDGCFVLWSTEEGPHLLFDRTSRRVVKCFEEGYSSPAVSPNGDWIAFCRHSEKQLYVWNTREQTQHVVPCDDLWGLQLTNNYIAFGNGENYATIEIWDLRTNTKVTEIQNGSRVVSFFLSPDDRYILSTSAGMYSIWSVSTGELISRSYADDRIYCFGFSHDSKSIALSTCSFRSPFWTTYYTIHVQPWDECIEPNHPHGNEIEKVCAIWQRGSYLILQYKTILDKYRLRISDITTTIFETQVQDDGPVDVCPNQENIHVAYRSSRGLCLWNIKEGEIVIDESARSIIALVCLDYYLISGCKETISVWDSRTRKLVGGPLNLPYELKSLLPVRGTRFAVIYGIDGDKVEVRECESGDRVGEILTIVSRFFSFSPKAVSANREHIIYVAEKSVDTVDLTGAIVSSIPFSRFGSAVSVRRSLNGKYIAWADTGKIKLFDVDTETLFTSPSLDRPVIDVWLSDDSERVIIISKETPWKGISFLDVWDIESKNMVTETIQCPFPRGERIETLISGKKHLIVFNRQAGVCFAWDLNTRETMSPLYKAPPLLAAGGSDIEGAPVSNKTEILDYALMAWKKASLPAFPSIDRDGWVRGLQGELLFWVPEKMIDRLWLPCMMYTLHRKVTKLNFTNFVHGTNWTECGPRDD